MRGILFSLCLSLAGCALLLPGWSIASGVPATAAELAVDASDAEDCCVCGVDCDTFGVPMQAAAGPDGPPAPRLTPDKVTRMRPRADVPGRPPPRS